MTEFAYKGGLTLEQRVDRLEEVINGKLGFGNAELPSETVIRGLLPGQTSTVPNGTPGNIYGSIVGQQVTANRGVTTFYHNLGIPVVDGLNVRWFVIAMEHDGQGVGSNFVTISLNFQTGDTVTENSVQLRWAAPTRTVDAFHPLYFEVFFIPGVRAPSAII